MNKKGFTLVELLAVISILAVLVIIEHPNVMGIFNSAKKTSFQTEVKQVYRVAQTAWVNDSLFTTGVQEYGRCNGCSYKKLDLTGRKEFNYYIRFDRSGCITKYIADDGTYRFEYNGGCLDITQITESMIATSNGEDVNSGDYVYVSNYSEFDVGYAIPNTVTTYNSYNDVVNATNERVFIRYGMNNGRISNVSIGFIYKGNVYYIPQGDSMYQTNKDSLINIFGNNCADNGNSITCEDDNMSVMINENHHIGGYSGIGWYCISNYNATISAYYGKCSYD